MVKDLAVIKSNKLAAKKHPPSLRQSTLAGMQNARVQTATSRAKTAAKDPGPKSDVLEEVEMQLDLHMHHFKDEQWTLNYLNALCTIKSSRNPRNAKGIQVFGNDLFYSWMMAVDWDAWPGCHRYGEKFGDGVDDTFSWEMAVADCLTTCKGDWSKMEKEMIRVLDRKDWKQKAGSDSDELFRQLIIGTAAQDPIEIFDFSAKEEGDSFVNRYWDKTDIFEPFLRVTDRPFAKFWALCNLLFDHPWTDPEVTYLPGEWTDLRKKRKRIGEKRQSQQQGSKATTKPAKPSASAQNSVNKSMTKNLKSTPAPPVKPATRTLNEISPAPPPDSGEPEAKKRSKLVTNRFAALSGDDSDDDEMAPPEDAADEPFEAWESDGSNSGDFPPKKVNDRPPGVINTALSPPKPKKLSFKPTEEVAPAQTFKTALLRQPYVSDMEKAGTLQQMSLEGIPRTNAKFVCVSMGYTWNGSEDEEIRIDERVTSVMVSYLSQALTRAPADLLLLPVSEFDYKNKKYWLKTVADVTKITTFQQLAMYIDLSWNNGNMVRRSSKFAGEKTLRTRIRIAYNSNTDRMDSMLHEIFELSGGGNGVYRSPLQSGNAVKIGFLINYPVGIDIGKMEKELMRHFRFKIAIALESLWPQGPGRGWTKGLGQPALFLWVGSDFARAVDIEMTKWFQPRTPKKDFPFGAVSTYVHEWKSVKAKKLSVPESEVTATAITSMINTHNNFTTICKTIAPSYSLHGMLTKATIPMMANKSISLLRVLYSVTCTPEQAEKAEGMPPEAPKSNKTAKPPLEKPSSPSTTGPTSSATNPAPTATGTAKTKSTDGSKSTEKTKPADPKKAKNSGPTPGKARARTSQETTKSTSAMNQTALAILAAKETGQDRNDEDKVDALKASLMARDRANRTPAPLFQMILPSPIHGCYIFVVRAKFEALANNVLNQLPAFLIYHLELWRDFANQRKALRSWMCKTVVETSINGAFVWDPVTLSATSEHAKNNSLIDENDLWLAHLQSPSDEERFKGALTINLKTASVRDMDDGATVASVLAELRRLQVAADLANELTVQNERLEADAVSAAIKIRFLEAQLAQQSIKDSSVSSNEQHNDYAQADAGGGSTGEGS
jgi:hypothetical protein